MKKKLFSVLLMCAVSAMLFSGCDYDYEDKVLLRAARAIYSHVTGLMLNDSGLENIDFAHKEAFDSAFNDIEIFGARFCVPMKVSELPDKFELSDSMSEYVPISGKEPGGKELSGGLSKCSYTLYYDKEVRAATVYIVYEEGQSIEDGIIYELEFDVFHIQPILLGGKVEVRFDMDEIKEFLGEGNEFHETSNYSDKDYCTLCYTDGDRIIAFEYGIQGDNIVYLRSYIKTYNNYDSI